MGYGSNCSMIGDMEPDATYGSRYDEPTSTMPRKQTQIIDLLDMSDYDKELLITSNVFQEQLSKCIAFKSKQILQLQEELLKQA